MKMKSTHFEISTACLLTLILVSSVLPFQASAEAERKKRVIVGLGDSTTAGTPGFLSPVEAPPQGRGNPESQYGYWLTQSSPEWKFLNRGVNGERSDQILRRFDRDVVSSGPEAVIVLAGVNDLYQGYPVDWIKFNLKEMYAAAGKAGIKVMACTVLPYDLATEEVRGKMEELNAWIRSYSQALGIGFCDTYLVAADPHNPGHLASSSDHLHPDINTYRKMGEALAEALRQWPGVKASG